ncbi:MAG TPA: glycosyl hydrolase [Acidimicrobiales bacterium]|nr:glycosyl hydrolase [Acidimicrobiales bacterium]
MRRGGFGAALLVLALSSIAGCTLTTHSGSSALGFFVSSQQPSGVRSLANTLGVQVQGISAYTDGTSWSSIGSYQPPATTLRLYLGVSMSPDNGAPSQTPAHLAVYQRLAQSLVNGGQPYAIIRIGWEWNTTFFSWGEQNTTPAQYVTAFDDIVSTMRSVPGQQFRFDWCAGSGNTPTNGSYADSYPGDQYVDYIGTDQYDNPVTSWNDNLTMVGGLAYTVSFAVAHGKVVSIPEWGLNGTDDPTFVDLMHSFIADPANQVGYSSYFSDNAGVDSDITQFPNAEAAFTRDFAG